MKEIKLTRGMVALVDDEDFAELSKFKWHAAKGRYTYYAERHPRVGEISLRRTVSMHRQILQCKHGERGDHKDCNGLNNCRANLRIATHAQNQRNRGAQKNSLTGLKGVCFDRTTRSSNKFKAMICIGGVRRYLGRFRTAKQAHIAYRAAVTLFHKDFARFA